MMPFAEYVVSRKQLNKRTLLAAIPTAIALVPTSAFLIRDPWHE